MDPVKKKKKIKNLESVLRDAGYGSRRPATNPEDPPGFLQPVAARFQGGGENSRAPSEQVFFPSRGLCECAREVNTRARMIGKLLLKFHAFVFRTEQEKIAFSFAFYYYFFGQRFI